MPKPVKRNSSRPSRTGSGRIAPSSVDSRKQLHDLQALMLEAVSRPLTPALTMRRQWNRGTPTSTVAEQFIKPNDRLSSFERLEIYNRQYWFRLLDCLYDDFPGLRAVLGEDRFFKMSQAYLAQYPSKSFQLRNLGRRLHAFLIQEPRWGGARRAMALDMAKFEWAQIEAFDAESRPVLAAADLAGASTLELKLKLQPYLSLLPLGFALDEFSIGLKKGASMHTQAAEGKRRIESRHPVRLPERKRIFLAVHRFNNMVFFKRLEEPAFALLEHLQRGLTAQEAMGRALPPFFSADPTRNWLEQIKQWFANWAELGWLCR